MGFEWCKKGWGYGDDGLVGGLELSNYIVSAVRNRKVLSANYFSKFTSSRGHILLSNILE
jgi:hypothetical protein